MAKVDEKPLPIRSGRDLRSDSAVITNPRISPLSTRPASQPRGSAWQHAPATLVSLWAGALWGLPRLRRALSRATADPNARIAASVVLGSLVAGARNHLCRTKFRLVRTLPP